MSTSISDTSREFIPRHIGPSASEQQEMLDILGQASLEHLMDATIPDNIRLPAPLNLPAPVAEHDALAELHAIAEKNEVYRSLIGQGYYGTHVPEVIKRNVLENPGWYTAYTPYQPEISQGRLEALLNFQQMVMDLTGMPVANASLLDEATAAAEAMAMLKRANRKNKSNAFFVADDVHPQSLDVIRTRASYMDIEVIVGNPETELDLHDVFAVLVQYPSTTGEVRDIEPIIKQAHAKNAMVAVASDLLALVLLTPPAKLGADVVLGSAQRFGVPFGFGGPHAAFFACAEAHKRLMPGRVIGVSKDSRGRMALRMAMQTREQHIRRDKATSNICTAQALLANMAGFYAVYHGAEGLQRIATRVHHLTQQLASGLSSKSINLLHQSYFDTITLTSVDAAAIRERAEAARINLRYFAHDGAVDDGAEGHVGISLDEVSTPAEVVQLWDIILGQGHGLSVSEAYTPAILDSLQRDLQADAILSHPTFSRYRSETDMMRYLKLLENRDFSLTHGMIPLGSCTMKLNAAAEMAPVTWGSLGNIHPFAPENQSLGYREMIGQLSDWLQEITGFDAISMQPNSGAQGEYAGLLTIRNYQKARGEGHRNVCLIPNSAHGTNPASAVMAGMKVVVVSCDENGNIDVDDLKAKVAKHKANLSAIMMTYPSTHGVFETAAKDICQLIHDNGGQVYMDGANMNAQVGLTSPAFIGADVTHLNLHKTFCIPHGGGGPGMGPIGVKAHLAPFLSGHIVLENDANASGAVAAAPYASASILPISWMYIRMMGAEGLLEASKVAILNANYIAKRLEADYNVLYKGDNGFVAHECILDIRPIKELSEIDEQDIAKRLIDYGFHAPTMSWPVAGTVMIEPTESESKGELDRFITAMQTIREEIRQVEAGTVSAEQSVVHLAPHSLDDIVDADWQRAYSREEAAYPVASLRGNKFWAAVNRVDNVYGDRNFFCACPPISEYEGEV